MLFRSADPAGARDELLHTMACKAAIKGGWRSGREELEEVARMVMSGAVKYCPHGRPVAIELTKKQLEKQFRLRPEQCVFIDDVPLNIEAAIRCGFHGIVYHNDPARLREELRALGVDADSL